MNESTAAAIREQAQAQAAVISNLEASLSDLQALKAATVEKLEQVTTKNPTDLATQIKLRGEVMAADQMVLEYSERLTAARAELASLETAARREAAIERIDAITKEALEERKAHELAVRQVMEFLAKQLPKVITESLNKEATKLKPELRTILYEVFGVQLDAQFDDLDHKREKVYRELEERGIDTFTIQSLANIPDRHRYRKPIPLDHVDMTHGAGRFYRLAQTVYNEGKGIIYSYEYRAEHMQKTPESEVSA